MTRLFGILIGLLMVATFGSVAFAKDSVDQGTAHTMTVQKPVPGAQLAVNSFEFNPDGVARDIYHLITGIQRPLDGTTSVTVQAGTSLQIGLTF